MANNSQTSACFCLITIENRWPLAWSMRPLLAAVKTLALSTRR